MIPSGTPHELTKMSGLFNTTKMSAGYARSRPPVHPHVIERIRDHLRMPNRFRRALDIGCGAGLSTAPLDRIAEWPAGVEPSEPMLRWSSMVAPGASFVAARAESLPIRSQSIDVITAAGSLNWVDLDLFFPEAVRVLGPKGILVIYDFSHGRSFRDSQRLDLWYSEFLRRYPSPPCRTISPETLSVERFGLRASSHEYFEIGLMLQPDFYLDYVMTETNVAEAVNSGTPEQEILEWCTETLEPVFDHAAREVLFRGYIVYVSPAEGRL